LKGFEMLIGAVIGLAIYSVIVTFCFWTVQNQVDRYNNALDGNLAKLTGKSNMIINYPMLISGGVTFITVGAVICYFI
jgi:large-conductance mechanosensitive channel